MEVFNKLIIVENLKRIFLEMVDIDIDVENGNNEEIIIFHSILNMEHKVFIKDLFVIMNYRIDLNGNES